MYRAIRDNIKDVHPEARILKYDRAAEPLKMLFSHPAYEVEDRHGNKKYWDSGKATDGYHEARAEVWSDGQRAMIRRREPCWGTRLTDAEINARCKSYRREMGQIWCENST